MTAAPTRVLGPVLLLSLAVGLLACTEGGTPPRGQAGAISSAPATESGSETGSAPADNRRAEVQQMLDERASAMLHGRRAAFARTVARGDDRGVQLARFRRLSRLPLASVALQLGTHDASVDDVDRYRAAVTELVQLEGFDPEPVPSDHQVEFIRVQSRWQVVSDTVDESQINQAPWDFPGTTLAFGDGVAVILDAGSASRAHELVDAVESARQHVNDQVPDQTALLPAVIVTAFSDTDALEAEGIPLDEIERLGGVAVPVRGADGTEIETRVVISPALLDTDPLSIRVILRHELAHVALRDYAGPIWMKEGIAEYVAWLGEPQEFVARALFRAAEEGITQMPPDGLFYRENWGVSYGISWFALKVLATDEDVDEPFRLLAALDEEQATRYEEVDAVLDERYGLTADELAERAGELVVTTFGP